MARMKIKHLECLRRGTYFKLPDAPCAVRIMRYAAANETVAMHDHDFSELVLVARGKITHLHADGTDRLRKGDFFVIHPGSRHGYADLTHNLVVYNLIFDANRRPPIFLFSDRKILPILYPQSAVRQSSTVLGALDDRTLKRVLRLLSVLQSDMRDVQEEDIAPDNLVFAAVIELLSAHCQPTDESDAAFSAKLRDSVLSRLSGPCLISDVADDLSCTERVLYRRIRKIYGTSPKQLFLQIKVEQACDLLVSTDLPLETAAVKSGFHDASHMSKAIRAHRGTTPGKLRATATGSIRTRSARTKAERPSSAPSRPA